MTSSVCLCELRCVVGRLVAERVESGRQFCACAVTVLLNVRRGRGSHAFVASDVFLPSQQDFSPPQIILQNSRLISILPRNGL